MTRNNRALRGMKRRTHEHNHAQKAGAWAFRDGKPFDPAVDRYTDGLYGHARDWREGYVAEAAFQAGVQRGEASAPAWVPENLRWCWEKGYAAGRSRGGGSLTDLER